VVTHGPHCSLSRLVHKDLAAESSADRAADSSLARPSSFAIFPKMNPLAQPPAVWSEEFKIHSYEVDLKRQATLETLCRYFQEAAWNHAEILGAGYHHLQRANKFWVLARLRLEVERFPLWSDIVTVNTWPRETKSVFALRDFELHDAAGARMAAGASAWLVLDATTHKPQRVDKLLASIKVMSETRATAQDPEKLPRCNEPQTHLPVRVSYGDIDVNSHVNNARYIGWLLDSYPLDFHRAHAPRVAEINFLAETVGGDDLTIASQQTSPIEFSHSIAKTGRGDEVCRARILWAPV
jgi:acyl-ACP thioesterase